jgi:hypothetical protein
MSLVGASFPQAQLRLNGAHAAAFRSYAVQTRDLVAVARIEKHGCLTRSAAEREVGAPCAPACSHLSIGFETSLAPFRFSEIFLRLQASTRRGRANRLA